MIEAVDIGSRFGSGILTVTEIPTYIERDRTYIWIRVEWYCQNVPLT